MVLSTEVAMTEQCNLDIVKQARRNIADKFYQQYHINAIMSGDWDTGELVKQEVERLLKNPPITESEDGA